MITLSKDVQEQVQSTFDFTVDKFPLFGPDNMRTSLYGLFRSDTQGIVGKKSVSQRYVPHQTDDVLALTDAATQAFESEMSIDCYFKDGHYVSLAPTDDARRSIYGMFDNIFPRVVISAGYNGRSFKATMGYYRDACRNLSMIESVRETTVAIRHTSSLRERMDSLIASFTTLKSGWTALTSTVAAMESRQVSLAGFLDDVYGKPDPNSKRATTIHTNRTSDIFTRVLEERQRTGRPPLQNDWMVSVWEAYNAVQGYVQHRAPRRDSGEFARIIAASNDPSVKIAESKAMSLIA